MQLHHGAILLSAEDLQRFSGCPHATARDLAALSGVAQPGVAPSGLSQSGEVGAAPDPSATRAALRAGQAEVSQPVFLGGGWIARTDLARRHAEPSELGAFSYRLELRSEATPEAVIDLVLAAERLAALQGGTPGTATLVLPDRPPEPLRLSEVRHYVRDACARLEAFVADPAPTRPEPCAACAACCWAGACAADWRTQDSLHGVGGIARRQVVALEAAGISTLAALADSSGPVAGMAPDALQRLRQQAQLQVAGRSGTPQIALRPERPGRGLAALPAPAPGDLAYACAGAGAPVHALRDAGGVTLLHDPDPALGLARLADRLRGALEGAPEARIYHHGPAPVQALRRLVASLGTAEALLDRLLREQRFVDLEAVARAGLMTSEPGSALEALPLFRADLPGAVPRTMDPGIPDALAEALVQDCDRILGLRDWLVSVRPEGAWPPAQPAAQAREAEEEAETAALRQMLEAADLPADLRALLFDLGQFHTREAKPAWWAIFDSFARDGAALIEDLDALGGLVALGPAEPVKRSVRRHYRYPAQESRMRPGSGASLPQAEGMASVTIEALDRWRREVTLKVGAARAGLLADRLDLHPDRPVNAGVLASALRDVIADRCGPGHYRAVADLLERRAPRLSGTAALLEGTDPVQAIAGAVARMQETVLPIQGPPGTGKTHVSARAILGLVRGGARVGIASNSHEAIRNLLNGVAAALAEAPLPVPPTLVHKLGAGPDGYAPDSPVQRTTDNARAAAGGDIVGGTAYFFARDENIQAFDWLFVDEAGQVGLANMAAMGRAARNLVLVGDPRQLPQVIQGAHPPPADLSCLDWLLGAETTFPPDRGIFLSETRRMHPQITDYISDQVYGGRLDSHPDTALQGLSHPGFPASGAYWVPVSHAGNAQTAPEEVTAIRACCAALLAGQWQGKTGPARPLRPEDIIVVAPYNAQVNGLREALPEAIRVGTVDRFQGQEAPVCLVSMTASSAEETARGLEFLVSRNRINVAVSRAKGLALVFGAPRLRAARCETLEQMRLVNTLCALPPWQGPSF
ncbi:AAA family ATPase [Pseudooceanicola sp. CBS1P-1]|uniref:AAA family ATPase n=1 Tax=Pseudooceanicola albus TaxID=2692189 RepID=A0A6L7G5Q7_9RHOB|nr:MULTISPECIES: AAA domain-containing protein [Pseudooceanicola]MBT9385236.1 AAA family ATPase [Pseudooceanicola endophyticus]MXN18680.1 AAA family ATPase [Pseudooceanicola albus]